MINDWRRKGAAPHPETVTQCNMEGPPARNSQVLLISLLISLGCVFVLLCLLGLEQFPKQSDPNEFEQCTYNYECPEDSACINRRCDNPCVGICQDNATCHMFNHVPYCSCKPGFSGNPFTGCQQAGSVLAEDMPSNNSQPRKKRFEVERFIKVNWYAAYAHCRYHGGRLAVIESKEENEQIKEAILKTNLRNEQFWTSGTDFPQGQWVWMTSGKPFTGYSDWEPGEPNNAGDEHCLQFFEKERKGYMWNDKNCMEQIYPICEY